MSDVRLWGPAGVVPGQKSVVLLLRVEQRGHGVRRGVGLPALLQPLQGVLKGDGLVVGGAQGRAHGGEAVPVFREDGVLPVQLQGLHKTLPQAHQEVEGPAQKDDLALQLAGPGSGRLTVWSTTAWKMEAATSSFRPPWFRMGWISLLANTPQREAMG